MGLGQLSVSPNSQTAKLYNFDNTFAQTDGLFLAAAAVAPSVGLAIGASVTLPGGSTPTTITGANIVAAIKAFAINGQAYYFGSGEIRGMKSVPVVSSETSVFGYAAGAKLTKRVTEKVSLKYDRWYGNETFFNQLLENKAFDWFFFTNNTVHSVIWSASNVNYVADGFGAPMEANPGEGITGTFGLQWVTDGFVGGESGVTLSSLSSDDVTLAISNPTIGGTGLTAGTCAAANTKKYIKTNAGAATLAFDITPANDCVDWGVYTATGDALPSGYGTFSSATKTLTLPATMAAGTYTYAVTVINKTGVKGQLTVEVTVLPA